MVNYVNNNYNLSIQVEVAIGNEEPVSETLKWIAHGDSCPIGVSADLCSAGAP